MTLSDRSANTFEFASSFSFPPQNFFTYFVPIDPYSSLWRTTSLAGGCGAGYFGILAMLLAGIGLLYFKKDQYPICFAVISIIAITIMLGHYSPLYKIYFNWIPGISIFRIPARSQVFLVFSMSILAGFGCRYLIEAVLTKKQLAAIISLVFFQLSIIIAGAFFLKISVLSREIMLAVFYCIRCIYHIGICKIPEE